MMTNSVPTPSRAVLVDFSHPIVYVAVSYLIPSSYHSNNIFSATKPFQTWVIAAFKTIKSTNWFKRCDGWMNRFIFRNEAANKILT